MVKNRVFLLILALGLMISGIAAAPAQESSEGLFIEETRHWIRGEFLDFWNASHDPLLIFGYPITESMPHPIRKGITIQYFQRARMELDESLPPGQRVKLASLGLWMYDETQRGNAANFPKTSTTCRSIGKNRIDVCYAFLQFYDRNNGPLYFGEPIAEAEFVDGRLVQYFENARMEWRPEKPAGQRVVLTDIGRIDFDITIGDENLILPPAGADIPVNQLSQIQVYAFLERPLLASGQEQTAFIIVHDQFRNPIGSAQVMITVAYPDGRVEHFRPAPTDADGLTQVRFRVDGVKPNQVVQVLVSAEIPNGPKESATTWFRIWW
ncbi:MAG: hypothetical protein GX491_07765 [Chloroflexi bacterium]|nr:hypothetical protein [Chloroflexota bacterium]